MFLTHERKWDSAATTTLIANNRKRDVTVTTTRYNVDITLPLSKQTENGKLQQLSRERKREITANGKKQKTGNHHHRLTTENGKNCCNRQTTENGENRCNWHTTENGKRLSLPTENEKPQILAMPLPLYPPIRHQRDHFFLVLLHRINSSVKEAHPQPTSAGVMALPRHCQANTRRKCGHEMARH